MEVYAPQNDEAVFTRLKEMLDFETGRVAIELYTLYRAKGFRFSCYQAYEKVLLALIARPIMQENKLDG